jgi:phosphatidate phosphatase APP1
MNRLTIKFQQIVIKNPKFLLNKKIIHTLIALFFLIGVNTSCALPLKKNEEVIIFPVSASMTSNGRWKIPMHHWVYEFEEDSFIKKLSGEVIAESLELAGLSNEDTDSVTFKQRIKWFLTDNKGWKELFVNFGKINPDKHIALNKTTLNGHAYTDIYLATKKEWRAKSWIQVGVDSANKDQASFMGEVQLIPANGLSIISDIDDTIKISEVLDKQKLLKNTFIAPYQAVKGMPELYKRLKERGAYFHYVSASPWRLYPELKLFIQAYYPKGTVMFRHFRLKDTSFIKFLGSSKNYKIKKITAIIKRYPKHRFILIGDSGEHDAEIYAAIYQQFPKNIQSIWIRNVPKSNSTKQNLAGVFKDVPRKNWVLFENPNKLKVR